MEMRVRRKVEATAVCQRQDQVKCSRTNGDWSHNGLASQVLIKGL